MFILRIKHFFENDKFRFFFILCGGQFYLDWILITNPSSKNPLIKFCWRNEVGGWRGKYEARLIMGYICMDIHIMAFLLFMWLSYWSNGGWLYYNHISNLLVNIYPVVVQIYINIKIDRILLNKKPLIKLLTT